MFFFHFISCVINNNDFWLGRSIAEVIDVGTPADWVKITVRETVSTYSLFSSHRIYNNC